LCDRITQKITTGCVMRIRYKIRQEQLASVDEHALRAAAEQALIVHFKPDVIVPQRDARMPDITETAVAAPLKALDTYLSQVAPDRKEELLKRARELCARLDAGN
jgi:hypothetical protein